MISFINKLLLLNKVPSVLAHFYNNQKLTYQPSCKRKVKNRASTLRNKNVYVEQVFNSLPVRFKSPESFDTASLLSLHKILFLKSQYSSFIKTYVTHLPMYQSYTSK